MDEMEKKVKKKHLAVTITSERDPLEENVTLFKTLFKEAA
jgi:hypothetical protein